MTGAYIGATPRRLEAAFSGPADAIAGAIVCHPHPLYGGDMHNAVVVTVADALAGAGWLALRFNFGGVGASEGQHDDGRAEVDDVDVAVATVAARLPPAAPIVVAGYSFGAWVALAWAARATGAVVPRLVVAIAPPFDLLPPGDLAAVRAPLAVVAGDRDQYCRADRLRAVQAASPGAAIRILAGADHFLAGREDEVARAVLDAATGALRPPR